MIPTPCTRPDHVERAAATAGSPCMAATARALCSEPAAARKSANCSRADDTSRLYRGLLRDVVVSAIVVGQRRHRSAAVPANCRSTSPRSAAISKFVIGHPTTRAQDHAAIRTGRGEDVRLSVSDARVTLRHARGRVRHGLVRTRSAGDVLEPSTGRTRAAASGHTCCCHPDRRWHGCQCPDVRGFRRADPDRQVQRSAGARGIHAA